MNKKWVRRNHRALILLLLILTLGGSLAAAPLNNSNAYVGNVQMRVVNGNLVLQGTDLDNNIIVTESGVSGRAGTTVNGERHVFFPDGVTNDIVISMIGGDDFVRVELPGTNFAIPHNLVIYTGSGDDTLELLQVKAPNDTRIYTGLGNDIVFIDGVLGVNEYIRSDFTGKFELQAGTGRDLLEFHHATFRGPVDVRMGGGIDGACNTQDSDFLMPDQAIFDGGGPATSPGDGFVAPVIQLTHLTGFENFPDDCSFLGGRF